MFTGLISFLGSILSLSRSSRDVWQLKVQSALFDGKIRIGDSIAINGCCCTVVALAETGVATFTLMKETINRTTFSLLSPSDQVHVERSAVMSDTIEGHVVTGHVSGVVVLSQKVYQEDGSLWLVFTLPGAPSFLSHKGSVAIDGVSLTVAQLDRDSFAVSLIPHTQQVTLLSKGNVGTSYNIEVPVIPFGCEFPLVGTTDLMELARKKSLLGRVTAPPNPWVGCVIINGRGEVIATGYHRKRGEIHAEVAALRQLSPGEDRSNYTLYCTLEPCNHTGMQPPCTNAIIESGIRRVVVGVLDPDTRVSGTGVQRLRNAGIEVRVMDDTRVRKCLTSYICHRQTGRPYVTGKMAVSLDGKIRPLEQPSRFSVSGEASFKDVHKLRMKSQAILIGTETALLDQPKLNVRLPGEMPTPLRCVVDRYGKVRDGPLVDTSIGPTLIFTSGDCPEETRILWERKNVQVCSVPVVDNHLSLPHILDELGKRGILSLLVEGGGRLWTSFIQQGLLDRIILYMAPLLLGSDGTPLFTDRGVLRLEERGYSLKKTQTLGSDIRLTYVRQK